MRRWIAAFGWVFAVLLALSPSAPAARAQEPAPIPRIGFLGTSATGPTLTFRQGLRDLGYVEGQTIEVEYRFNEGRADRLPALAAELVALTPDVLVAAGAVSAQALKAA